jgi:hypothetical protein
MPFGETQAVLVPLAAARTRMTGTTTSREPYYLINSAADFSAVKHGWLVVNLDTMKATYAIKPVSVNGQYTKLLLQDDIFTAASGQSYEILRYSSFMLRPPYGLEPRLETIRWFATPADVDPTIYGVELWATNNLTPAVLLEKTTRRIVTGIEGTNNISHTHKTNAEGLIVYSIPVQPTYHAAIEIRNYSKRTQTIYLAGFNKSQPIVPTGSESSGGGA